MNDVCVDIVSWLHKQQNWLQLVAKRIITQEGLNDEGFIEVISFLKTPEGQSNNNRLDFSEFSNSEGIFEKIKINSIGNIYGIDNLSPNTPLQLGKTNLTAVYGNNGSGKSGYVRILKKICGKPNAIHLRPNVFKPEPNMRQCEISYNVSGIDYSDVWIANSQAIDVLKSVDIFDAHSGKVYLDKENDASYIPETVALFEDLVGACKSIKSLLEKDRNSLQSKLPAIPVEYTNTKYGVALGVKLQANVSKDTLKEFFTCSKSDEQNKTELEGRLKDDPTKLANKKRKKKYQIESLLKSVIEAVKLVDSKACRELFTLQENMKSTRQIVIEGAVASTEKAQLSGIGTKTWMALWKAAKEYSVMSAYPEIEFPNVDEDSLCVLCHQELDTEAKLRIKDFECFVNSSLEETAAKAEKEYKQMINNLPVIPIKSQLITSIQAAQLNEDDWLPIFSEIWSDIDDFGNRLKQDHEEVMIGYALPDNVFKELIVSNNQLDIQVAQHEADAEKFDKIQLTKNLNDLKAKQWANGHIESILAEADRLKQVNSYNAWIASTNHRAISMKAGEISKQVITQTYVDRFNNELSLLGAKNIRVELVKTKVTNGKVKHKVQLHGVVIKGNRTPDILSEGEYRIVSLAAFLADVMGKPQNTPFIFDDPISSLDHDYEWNVARRLVNLSVDRQVLIFTHRLSLYGAVEDWSKKMEKFGNDKGRSNLTQLCIEEFEGTTGHMSPPDTWTAKTNKANNILIDKLKKAHKASDIERGMYKTIVQGICSEFRKLLERTIEDDLLATVVRRHRRSITTDGRLPKLSKISPDDCSFFDDLMTKYSCYEHSQSQETPVLTPTYQDLLEDLEKLKNWREKFNKRPNEVAVSV